MPKLRRCLRRERVRPFGPDPGVWILVSGGFLVAGRGRHRPSFTVVGLASAAGLTGAIAGLMAGFSAQGTFLGSNHLATRWMLVGAGIGWIVGAIIGMSVTKGTRTADHREIVVLGIAASVTLLSAVFVATWLMVPEFFCVDGAIYTDLATVDRLRWAIVTDGAIASAKFALCRCSADMFAAGSSDRAKRRSAERLVPCARCMRTSCPSTPRW